MLEWLLTLARWGRQDRTKLEKGFQDLLSHAAPTACTVHRERESPTQRQMHLAKLTFCASQKAKVSESIENA